MATQMQSTGTNKALVRRLYDELYGRKNPAVIDELLSPGYVHHFPDVLGKQMDFADYKRRRLQLVRAFPDLAVTIEDQIAEGDRVSTRATTRGTQMNDLPNIPASGRAVEVVSIVIHRIADGKIAEGWEIYDSLGMMMQLDIVHMVTTLSKAEHERGRLPQDYRWTE